MSIGRKLIGMQNKNFTNQVTVQNLDEFLELVEKAKKQASALKVTLKEIDDFEFKTKQKSL